MLSCEDRLDIHELVALYGHVMDDRLWSRLDELFTSDVVYDLSAFDHDVANGIVEVRELLLNGNHPLAHHATNVVMNEEPDRDVRVIWKGIGVGYRGRVGSTVYKAVTRRTEAGWRIRHLVATLRTPDLIPAPS